MNDGGDVTLWQIPLPDKPPSADAWALLDTRERERAERFLRDRDRYRFVAAHAGLRLALAAETGQPPSALRFTALAHGKPQLERVALSFNMSHSGDLAVVATCRGRAVGVDIETTGRLRDLDGLAGMVMTEDECAAFSSLAEDRRAAAFLRLWTRKEALLKADGRGLTNDPRNVEVGLGETPERVVAFDGRSWTLRDVPIRADVTATVCVEGPLGSVRQRGVEPRRQR